MSRPQLLELVLDQEPGAWAAAGFAVRDAATRIGPTTLRFAGGDGGIRSMAIEGVPAGEVDGLALHAAGEPAPAAEHPLGVVALDHVVVLSDDADRTSRALDAAGLDLRRMQDVPGDRPLRRGFVLAREALVEVVAPAEAVGYWGLTVVVRDLDAAVEALGEHCGTARDAVQPGRRIATVRPSSGIGVPLALITPRSPV